MGLRQFTGAWEAAKLLQGLCNVQNPTENFRCTRMAHTGCCEIGVPCSRLLRASVSCDAQQLIAISHRAPDWTSASLLRPSRLPLASCRSGLVTTASSGVMGSAQ